MAKELTHITALSRHGDAVHVHLDGRVLVIPLDALRRVVAE